MRSSFTAAAALLRGLGRFAGIIGFFALTFVGIALAHAVPRPIAPVPAPVQMPIVKPTTAPQVVPSPGSSVLRRGRHPLLSSLPPLPRRSAENTRRPGRVHTLAANGDDLNFQTQTGCGGNSGQIYAVGCQIQWKFQAGPGVNPPGTDQLEDCFAPNNQPNTRANCSAPFTGGDPGQTTTLSASGIWVFGTLDVTTGTWLAVDYLPVGSGIFLDTFSDSFDNVESTQFTAASGTSVFIEATGLVATDRYEVYVEYDSVAPTCVFTAPAESPAAPLTNALCNPANDTGALTASGGVLQVQWPLSTSDQPGAYAIGLFDITQGQRLAQRQVSLIASATTGTMTLTPQGGNPSPNPVPAATPAAIFAFDSSQDQSDKGFTIVGTGFPANINLTGTISDPTGQVTNTFNQGTGGAGTFNHNFTFNNSQQPTNYPTSTYTLTMLNQTTHQVIHSQGFRIVGYQVQTTFTNPAGTAINTTNPVTTGLQFLNTGGQAFGSGNGDPIRGIVFDNGGNGLVITLLSGTSCGVGCQTETVSDSNGILWNVMNVCTGGTGNMDCTITALPMTTGQALAIGASLTLGNVQFAGSPGNHCSGGCSATTSILPLDGLTWSQTNQQVATNSVFFTNGTGAVSSATGHIFLFGYRDSAGVLHTGQEAHGYTVRAVTAGQTVVSYTGTSPSSTGSAKLEYMLTITNTTTGGGTNINQFGLLLPAQMSNNSANYSVDTTPGGASNWQVQGNCPGGFPAGEICLNKGGGNNGIAPGASQTIFLEAPPPTSSFTYTDVALTTVNNPIFGINADGTYQVFDDTVNPTTVDTTALVGYSLNSSLMTVATSPTSIGTNTSPTVAFSISNTISDANPDFLDAVVVAVPTANALSNIAVSTPGWSEIGSFVVGGNTEYLFGLCPAQSGLAFLPPNDGMPSCGSTVEQTSGLAPGATLNFSATLAAGSSAGAISMSMFAHGANGNGWSAAKNFSETVSTVSVNAGFSSAGAVGAPASIATGVEPTIGADSSAALGNAFVYTISNTSGSGASNNVTSMTITIPGQDTSGNNGADSANQPWQITNTPTLSGSGFSNCSVTSFTSATAAGANGSIVIGGTGCTLTPGGVMNVSFDAKAPYKVNDTYRFSTTANGGAVVVSEAWTNDTEMKILLSANLNIIVNPAADPNAGISPAPNCTTCTFSANSVDFGTIANPGSQLGTDVMAIEITTDASAPEGWQLDVLASSNPANTAGSTFANELAGDVDSTHSISGAGVNYDQTSLAVIPVTSPGLRLVDTGAGTTARRLPFGFVTNYEIFINGGATTAQNPTLTFTFIAN